MPLERTNVTLLPFCFFCSLRSVLVTSLNVETCKARKLVWRCFESLSMRLFELALVTNSWWSLFKTPLSKSVNKIMNLDKPSGLPVTNWLALFIKRSTIGFICNDRNPGSICRTTLMHRVCHVWLQISKCNPGLKTNHLLKLEDRGIPELSPSCLRTNYVSSVNIEINRLCACGIP